MIGRAFLRTKSRISAERLRRDMTGVFGEAARVRSGAVVATGQVRIGDQRYNVSGLPSSAQAGSTLNLRNVGRRAAASYIPDAGGSSVTASSSSGSGGSAVVSGMAGLQDDNDLRVLPDASGYVRIHGDAGGVLDVVSDGAYNIGIGININAIDHNGLTNLTTGDPHTQYGLLTGTETISGLWTFSRSTNPPFAVNSGAAKVANLDADKLDGLDSTAFLSPQYLTLATNTNLTNERVLVAGGGLTISDGGAGGNATIAVGEGNGITVNADDVAVNQAYSFTWTGTHTFQTNDVQMDVNLDFVGAQSITTTAGNLTIAPAGDVVLTPGGGDVLVAWGSGKSLTSSNYVSQTTGWGISYGTSGGHADFRSMYADELHVQAFIADVYQAIVGGLIITPGRARLSRNFTIPADAGTGTLYLEDNEGFENAQVFASGDYVRLRYIDTSGGGLVVTDAWGTVSSYSNLSGGEQSWTFTTTDDGGVGGETIFTGAIALGYGQSGDGVWEATVLDSAGSPYSQVTTWVTDPSNPANFTTHLRLGNLDGISGIGAEYGLWSGQNTTDTYILLSDSSFEAHGLRLSLYSSGTERIRLDPAVPSIGLGATLPTAFGEDGIWMGRHSDGTYRLSIEEPNGDQYLRWTYDESRYRLELAADLYLKNSPGTPGSTDVGATLWVDENGLISMGQNSHFQMHDGATPAPNVKIDFHVDGSGNAFATIGDYLGGGSYLYYDGITGDLTFKGKMIITGGDLLPIKYQPASISAAFKTNLSPTSPTFLGESPYGFPGLGTDYIAGTLLTADGSRYWLYPNGSVTATSGGIVYLVVAKTSIDSPLTIFGFSNVVTVVPVLYADWMAQTVEYRSGFVIIGEVRLDEAGTAIKQANVFASSDTTIITNEFIYTPHLEALSAQMGHLQGGQITLTNDTNTLWLNDGANDIVFAVGTTAGGIAAAAFRVYEDGDFHAGGAANNYLDWNGTKLIVKGDIRADAGYLGALDIDGNLTMSGGKIQWNSTDSFIDDAKIVVSENGTKSILRIGDTSQSGGGILDIDLFQSADSAWTHGVHINDGGNKLSSASSLYHGESNNISSTYVDRIFDARTYGNSRSDGYYGEMSAYDDGITWDAAGAVFKGRHLSGGPVALFSQHPGSGGAAVVWVDSSKVGAKLVKMQSGSAGQTGIYLDNPSGYTDFVAMSAGLGQIREVTYLVLKGNMPDPVPGTLTIPAGYFAIYMSEGGYLRKMDSSGVTSFA